MVALLAGSASAQYRFDQWTADDGLPQNSIYSITQTKDGYLWLATLDGLVRFDGVRFTVFNKSNSPGIRNNRFTALFEDVHGDLWASTEQSGLTRLHKGHFSSYGEEEGIPHGAGLVGRDADGNAVVLLSEGQTIHSIDGKFSLFDWASGFSGATSNRRQQTNRVSCRNFKGSKVIECIVDGRWLKFTSSEGLPDYTLLGAAQDSDGSFWVLTNKRELAQIKNGKVVRVLGRADGLPKYPAQFLYGARLGLISRDEQGSLWSSELETLRNTLVFKKVTESKETGSIFTSYQDGEDPVFNSYKDDEGNLWFGTRRNGLYRARKKVVSAFSTAEGLTDNNTYTVFEDRDGTIWLGTTNGLFSFQNGQFTRIESNENLAAGAIGKDPAGRIVISNYSKLYVREANRFVPFLNEFIPKQSAINAIHTDSENTFWIGSETGLIRYKNRIATTYTNADGLAGNDVKIIIDAKAGGIWIGTYGGLSHFRSGQLKSWTEKDGLPSPTIRSLYEDTDGSLWIGSYDGGLARFRDGTFTHFNTHIGLYNDGAFQILEDELSNFWISSNRGIYRVSRLELNEYADGKRKTITSIAYGKSDGMLNIECNGGRSPAGVKTRDGRLWFPTQDGLAMIDPKEIQINKKPPPIVIESVKIDNKLSSDFAFDSETSATTNPQPAIRIEPSQQNFEIQYTALSFINSENLRFKYRLEGLDEDWVEAGTRRTAYYSYVPPGEYRFQIIAANSDGVWNTEGKSLNIIVVPPFYRTWWFTTLASLAVAAFVFLFYRRRIYQLKRSKQAQEDLSRRLIDSQENERKRLAGELHDGLSQNLVIIKNRALISLAERDNIEHAFEQIEEIAEAAGDSLAEVREIAGNLRPFQIDRLGLTKAIEAIVRKSNSPQLIVEAKLDNIDKLLSPEMEINLYRILQESLNNIIKHSKASGAKIEIEKAGKNISIRIRDNGRGFNQKTIENEKSGGGFGLPGMNERARILGSVLVIESTPQNGTLIKLNINY